MMFTVLVYMVGSSLCLTSVEVTQPQDKCSGSSVCSRQHKSALRGLWGLVSLQMSHKLCQQMTQVCARGSVPSPMREKNIKKEVFSVIKRKKANTFTSICCWYCTHCRQKHWVDHHLVLTWAQCKSLLPWTANSTSSNSLLRLKVHSWLWKHNVH